MKLGHAILLTGPIQYLTLLHTSVVKDIWIKTKKIAQEYGCTHVALIDGCSRMICGYASMEVKNLVLIYEYVFRPAISKYGLWNQLRIYHGHEFSLCIFVQDLQKELSLNYWRRALDANDLYTESYWTFLELNWIPALTTLLNELWLALLKRMITVCQIQF